METKNKIITIRENLIREIEDKNVFVSDIAINCRVDYFCTRDYLEHKECENHLNGAEIQRIFNYLNGLK